MITRLNQVSSLINSKNEFIKVLSEAFFEVNGEELQIATQDTSSLTYITTTKDEKEKNPNASKMPKFNLISATTYLNSKGETMLNEKNEVVLKSNERNLKINKKVSELSFFDFELLKKVGVGSVSSVFFAKYKETSLPVALKVTEKALVLKKKIIQNTGFEKDILTKIDFPFKTPLITAFQSTDKLCLVMPFYAGGDLFNRLNIIGSFSEEMLIIN